MSADLINACFEGVGSILLWTNVRRLHIDKKVSGVSLIPTAFFTVWGCWGVYFYSAVSAPLSLYAGLGMVVANAVWWGQVIYYRTARGD